MVVCDIAGCLKIIVWLTPEVENDAGIKGVNYERVN
jgi:hypothetical protein